MADIMMTKTPAGALIPASEDDSDKLRKIKAGATVRCTITQPRNIGYHRKFFSMLTFLFGIWEETMPRQQYRGHDVKPNIDRFRHDLIVLSGRYRATYNVRGEVRLEAESISFASMSQESFEALFSDIINIALAKVLDRPDLTEEKIRAYCEQVMAYD